MHRFRNFVLMAPEGETPSSGSSGTTPPASETPAGSAAQPDPAAVKAIAELLGWKNVDELRNTIAQARYAAKLGDEVKELKAKMGETPAPPKAESKPATQEPKPGATSDEVAMLRSELQLTRELADLELPPKTRRLIERLFKAEQPKDVTAWLPSALEEAGIAKGESANITATSTTTQQAAQTQTTDTGAPAGAKPVIPTHPSALTKEAIASMTPLEIAQFYERYKRTAGASQGNPYAKAKQLAAELKKQQGG